VNSDWGIGISKINPKIYLPLQVLSPANLIKTTSLLLITPTKAFIKSKHL
jgi:hypothetical protein